MKSMGKRAAGLRLERMQQSPLWSSNGFQNIHPKLPGLRDPDTPFPSARDFLFGGERRAPETPLPSVDPRDGWAARSATGLRATWLGHSTVLLEMDGARVLTDPVWGARASPSRLVGPKRFQPVPIRLRDIGALDAVVISHDHYDHLDYPTIRALAKTPVPFITSLGVGAHLERWGIPAQRIHELDWWETYASPKRDLQITAAPSQHFSGRGLKDRNATLWSSMVLRTGRHRVFFSGDTGLTTEYAAIRERLGPFDLVMLEVGAFHPAWGDIHLGPHNALKALELLGGGAFLPVHWGTFSLAMHAWDDPVETLMTLSETRTLQLVMPRLGEVVEPAQVEGVRPWWRGAGETSRDARIAPPPPPVERQAAAQQDQTAMPWPID